MSYEFASAAAARANLASGAASVSWLGMANDGAIMGQLQDVPMSAGDGGTAELLRLAWPLVLTSSFHTLQVTTDRVLLSRFDEAAVAAAVPAAALFWTPFALLLFATNYATTFVAQYVGAGRPERVGPAVWQAIYFAGLGGLAFLFLVPVAEPLVALGDHAPELQALESTYFRCLCFSALPALVTAAVSSFFAGRGRTRTVLVIDATGLAVNAVAAYGLIFGVGGLPRLGIAGAGWATVLGSTVAACTALALMLLPDFESGFRTRSGWRFDRALFGRLLKFGLPSGLQWGIDVLAFTAFLFLLGRWGETALAASSIAMTLNMIAFVPALGLGQGVAVLVGRRIGEDRPAVAEQTTWAGFRVAWLYMAALAAVYVLAPGPLVWLFEGAGPEPGLRGLTAVILRFVAVYSLFDSMNAIFSSALRGAGDTRFVSLACLGLSWPIMVVPTWLCWRYQWGITAAWTFGTLYVSALGLTFLARFRGGRWKSMRVIECSPVRAYVQATAAPVASVVSDD